MSYFLVSKNLLGLLERVQHNVIIIYVILSRWRYTSESFILLNMFAKSILLFFCRSGVGIYHAACGRFLAQLFIIPMISGQGRARSEITPFIFDLESLVLPFNISNVLLTCTYELVFKNNNYLNNIVFKLLRLFTSAYLRK